MSAAVAPPARQAAGGSTIWWLAALAAAWAAMSWSGGRWEGSVLPEGLTVVEVSMGCAAMLVLRWLLSDGGRPGSASPPGRAAAPRDALALEKAKALRSSRSRLPSPTAAQSPSPWWSCCLGRGAEGDLPRLPSRREISSAPWIHEEGFMHPKFCGCRLDEPSSELPLHRFPLEPIEVTAAPEHFAALLPCSDQEWMQCEELRRRVAGIPGPKDPVTMLRYLCGRQGRLDAATDMYRKAMAWHASHGLAQGFRLNTVDDSLHRRLDAYWPPTGLLGFDSDGDPLYWNRMAHGDLGFLAEVPAQFLGRHEVYSVTRILQALEELSTRQGRPRMRLTAVVDLSGLSLRHLNVKAAPKYKHVVRIMEDYFPEMVKRIVVVRAPRVTSILWKAISPFFDEGTRNKIQIADDRGTFETLSKIADAKWIPRALGGLNESPGTPWSEPAREPRVPRQLLKDIIAATACPGFVGC